MLEYTSTNAKKNHNLSFINKMLKFPDQSQNENFCFNMRNCIFAILMIIVIFVDIRIDNDVSFHGQTVYNKYPNELVACTGNCTVDRFSCIVFKFKKNQLPNFYGDSWVIKIGPSLSNIVENPLNKEVQTSVSSYQTAVFEDNATDDNDPHQDLQSDQIVDPVLTN